MRVKGMYTAYVKLEVDKDNYVTGIVGGFCVCPAGIKFDCQHIGATLWTVCIFVTYADPPRLPNEFGEDSPTSKLCMWIKPSEVEEEQDLPPIDQYVFRKLDPRKKKKQKNKKKNTVPRERNTQDLYARGRAAAVNVHRHTNIDATEALLGHLDSVNAASQRGQAHLADTSRFDDMDWDNLSVDNFYYKVQE
jgi:hypothetical protein